ncbi:MAG: hypothetical protein BAJALOKI2v1_100082 [Promethearchaeota archaeon]|nr:MAG: hypothetical protein BAJALOKI2v1_100082 [Candidatus Lokiarchaeota archaeon]
MKTRSEDTIIFNALTPEITQMDYVYESIEEFCKFKKEKDRSDRFNIIIFQDDGPNYLEDFTLNPEHILIVLRSLEPVMIQANVAGGIMTAITFIIDVYKKISEKVFRLIILTDSKSKRIPEKYIPVLEHLIDKVKDMPFFIDIIRIEVDEPEEDKKLMNLANRCHGNIHEINDIRGLTSIMEVLSLKREIPEESFLQGNQYVIPKENRSFYENLADNLLPLETNEISCSICFQEDEKEMVKCPRCETAAHKVCWANWASSSNIGIPNVFRCPNCYNLIRLDKRFVEMVKYQKIVGRTDIKIEGLSLQEYLESLEAEGNPKVVKAEDPMALPNNGNGLIARDLGKLEITHKASGEEKRYEKVWCTNCNKMISTRYKFCPNCKTPVEKD